MHFLSPIWFIALAALGIPVVIHLWNIKAGKTLKVGSISLITEASKTNRRSFKLLDILLLITRCLLLAVLAAFLAAPIWQYLKPADKAKGWVLIPKENLRETYRKFSSQIESLGKTGYEFHYFNTGFEQADLKKTLADTTVKDTASAANYWSFIKQLNTKAPANLPVYVFSPNTASHFKGDKPGTGLKLHWQTYTAADSVSRWIAAAAFTNTGAVKITVGNSHPGGTTYTSRVIQNEGNADFEVKVASGLPYISLKGSPHAAFPVDTATMRVAIYTDKYALDAGYLKAALTAATDFAGQKAIIKQYSNAGQIPGGETWLFWLSDRAIDARLAKTGKNIFRYEPAKVTETTSWINTGSKFALSNGGKAIALAKLVASGDKNEALWNDGFGRPVLSKKNRNYAIFTHFNPLWNDLVWSEDFPKLILALIAPEEQKPTPEIYDRRILTDVQLQPSKVSQGISKVAKSATEQTDLSGYYWLLLIALFATERILSHQKNKLANG